MAARAIWKGVIRFGAISLPVKLYSAVTDRTIHFRLLHRTDHAPVKQQFVSSASGKVVAYEEVKKAYPVGRGNLVVLEKEELEQIEPKPSRDIEITRFVSPASIDHRWYERAYYLGPDGDRDDYFAVVEALAKKKKEGVARWVMRGQEYVGALRAVEAYLMLIALRHADEVIATDALEPPGGRSLQKREIQMAEQLLGALEETFDPARYEDQYRKRVMEMIDTKSRGGTVKVRAFKRPKKTDDDRLAKVLEASLADVAPRRARG